MADKELRRLKRRELLEMLLVQCQEAERLQHESDKTREEFEVLSESYERLKKKLDVKDERLNQKDAKIAELRQEIEELKMSKETEMAELKKAREAEMAEVGIIVEAALKLSEACEEARRASEQYLLKMGKLPERSRTVPVNFAQRQKEVSLERKTFEKRREAGAFTAMAVSGGRYGR